MFEKILKVQLLVALAVVPFYTTLNVVLQSKLAFRESNLFITASAFLLFVVLTAIVLHARRDYIMKQRILLRPVVLASGVFCTLLAVFAVVDLLTGGNYRTVIIGVYGYALPIVAFLGAYLLATAGVLTESYFKRVLKVLIVAYALVAVFALASYFVLPRNVLDVFGYTKMGIRPYQYVGTDVNNIRVLSFTAGPNQLGIYAALMIPVCWYARKKFGTRGKRLCMLLLAISPVVIYVSKSRSALVALLVVLGGLSILNYKKIYKLIVGQRRLFVITLILFSALLLLALQSARVQSTLGRAGGSDRQRLESWSSAVRGIAEKPMGHGVGASGKGSYYSEKGPVIIENYYLQVAYDIGIVGVIVWTVAVSLILLTSGKLGHAPRRNLAVSLLLVILTANIFLPAMNDVLLAVLPFTLVGFVLGSDQSRKLNTRKT